MNAGERDWSSAELRTRLQEVCHPELRFLVSTPTISHHRAEDLEYIGRCLLSAAASKRMGGEA